MIFYDFSLHISDLLRAYKKPHGHPLGIGKLFNKISEGDREKREKLRQVFWTIYWGIAFILLLLYFLL